MDFALLLLFMELLTSSNVIKCKYSYTSKDTPSGNTFYKYHHYYVHSTGEEWHKNFEGAEQCIKICKQENCAAITYYEKDKQCKFSYSTEHDVRYSTDSNYWYISQKEVSCIGVFRTLSKNYNYRLKSTFISPYFLEWKFFGKTQFSHSLRTRKLGEIMTFYAVNEAYCVN